MKPNDGSASSGSFESTRWFPIAVTAAPAKAAAFGIADDRIVVDPGIGFAKTAEHNLRLLAHLDELGRLGHPVLLGVSRKAFIGASVGPRSRKDSARAAMQKAKSPKPA
mgnify:CR=1 FL=1